MKNNIEKKEAVNHPSHYNFGKIEVIEYLDDKFNIDEQFGFYIGNVIKYVSRAKHKNNMLEDLKKAQFYLNRLVSNLDKENK